jgi:uncharacterized membrane protein YeaQ/YmgE (transglycosylase-associated protein family)
MLAAAKLQVRPRQVVAFLLAPLAPGFLAVITSLFHNPAEGFWVLKLSAMLTYPTMLVLGVPAHLLLVKRGWTSGWIYTPVGLMIGACVAEAVFGWFAWNPGLMFLGATFGALIAFIFWAIARPDRSYSV